MNKRQKKKLEGRTGSVVGVKVTLSLTEIRRGKRLKGAELKDWFIDKAIEQEKKRAKK